MYLKMWLPILESHLNSNILIFQKALNTFIQSPKVISDTSSRRVTGTKNQHRFQ